MRTALVTGANKGIGHEVAKQLARRGFHVFVGARNAGAGNATAEELNKDGAKATFLLLDVSNIESVTNAAKEFSKISNHLDVLVNNAAILFESDSSILT